MVFLSDNGMTLRRSTYAIFLLLWSLSISSLSVYLNLAPSIPIPSSSWWHSDASKSTTSTDGKATVCSAATSTELELPLLGPTTLSHIVFSLAGSASTWNRRQYYSKLWWAPHSTRGFVWLDESPPAVYSWLHTYPPYKVLKFDPTRDHRGSDRIARIVKAAFDVFSVNNQGGDEEEVRWFVMGDDDTVFFKENLATVLSRYDHRRMWYIGGSSESVEQNDMHSYLTAFGGGGFAISYPLACQLARLMDYCLRRYANYYGSDEKISACVGELGVGLTRESGFHQLDIRGNPYGLLAAHPIAPLVSLHHLEEVDPLFPQQTQMASLETLHRAYRLDPPRILQQSICYSQALNWSLSVSWGYTVQLYPWLLTTRELELPLRTFKTWHTWKEGPFEFNTRPVVPDSPCDGPIFYFLDQVAEVNARNETLATYKRVPNGKRSCELSSYIDAASVEWINVVSSKMDPAEWLMAPQRQCCEININNGGGRQRNVKVTVRRCKFGETVSG